LARREHAQSYSHSSTVLINIELTEDEEEVLAALADSLKDMVDYIGGSQYIMSIVTPLEFLTSIEETTVREAAIESIKKILSGVKIKDHEPQIKIMLNKMMSSDWYTSKISCVCLSAPIYKNASPSLQLEILE
jgi:serine/threonine-protein phosphatase 2A regulatory subunit A